MNKLQRRVNDSILKAFNNVDGGGNYISKDIKPSLDQYPKSIHNLMGLVTGAMPATRPLPMKLGPPTISAIRRGIRWTTATAHPKNRSAT